MMGGGPCGKHARQEEELMQRAGMGSVYSSKSKTAPVTPRAKGGEN